MLTMEITNQNSNVKVGESTVFEISVSNDGTTPANDLVIKLTIPDNAELISIEQDDPSARVTANYTVDGNVITVTLGNISAGVAVKVYMNLRVTAAGDLKVTATAAGQNLEAEAEAESKAITVNADEIVRIQRTIGPAPLCGLFGGATLLLTMGMLVTWRTGRRFRPIHNQKKSTLRKGAAMKAKRTMRIGILSAILMIFTGGSTGCIDPSTATFLLGYVLGRTTAPTVLSETCTVNGEVVDCSTLQQ